MASTAGMRSRNFFPPMNAKVYATGVVRAGAVDNPGFLRSVSDPENPGFLGSLGGLDNPGFGEKAEISAPGSLVLHN